MLKPYIKYHGHVMLEVRCKGDCDAILVLRRGPAQNLRIERTPNYCELVIETDTGNGLLGKHETAVCKPCRERILAMEPGDALTAELIAIYAQDVHQWIVSATTAARPRLALDQAQRLAARFAAFTPLRPLRERGRGDRNVF